MKLSIFNCSSKNPSKIDLAPENPDLPSKLFIIGLFMGDGSLGFVFDEPKARAPKFYIKIFFNFASQKAIDSNVYLLSLVAKAMGLEPRIYKKAGSMISLEYAGETVFKKILPFLSEHREWLYWRERQFNVALSVAELFSNKRHLTKVGSKEVIELLYSIPNQYSKPKTYWLDLIEKREWK